MPTPVLAPLTNDFAPLVRRPSAALVVAEVAGLRNVIDDDRASESGFIDFVVRETLRDGSRQGLRDGSSSGRGAPLAVPFARPLDVAGKLRPSELGWSDVVLLPTALLLLAVERTADPGVAIALGARSLEGLEDPEIAALRSALALEAFGGSSADLRARLGAALVAPALLVREHAIVTLREGRLPREDALAVVLGALSSRGGSFAKAKLAGLLGARPIFDPGRGADRTNARALEALVRGVVEAAGEVRGEWARALREALAGTEPSLEKSLVALLDPALAPAASPFVARR